MCFIFTNRPLWYRSVFDALDGDRLRDTLCGSSELILIAAALNMGGLLTLITYDLSRSYAPGFRHPSTCHLPLGEPLRLPLLLHLGPFQLYTLHIYLPVHLDNLRDVVRSTRILPMTGALFFAISAWGMFLGCVGADARPWRIWRRKLVAFERGDAPRRRRWGNARRRRRMRAHKSPLLRGEYAIETARDRANSFLVYPMCAPLLCASCLFAKLLEKVFAHPFVPFFVRDIVARTVAHSGALAEGQVLPQEASTSSYQRTP